MDLNELRPETLGRIAEFSEASGEQRGEGSLGRNGGAKAYDEGGLACGFRRSRPGIMG